MDKVNTKSINKLLLLSLTILAICFIFAILKYVGILELIKKIIEALVPVGIAIFLSFILEPLIGFFLKKGIKRKYSVLIVYLGILLFIGIITYFVVPILSNQINNFIDNVPSLISIVEKFTSNIGISVSDGNLANTFKDIFLGFSKNLIKYLSSSFSVIFKLLLGISGAIFLSFDFPKFREGVKKHIPKRLKEPVIYYFQKYLPFIHKYFLGMLLDSCLIFLISIIGFNIIGINYTLVISLFIAITNLIPIIGPYIGGIPAAIVGFSISPTLGVSAIIVVVLVQIIESSIVQPLILKNTILLHPLEGILGISLFGTLFGVIGMIMSPILIVGIKLLFAPYKEKELNENKEFII